MRRRQLAEDLTYINISRPFSFSVPMLISGLSGVSETWAMLWNITSDLNMYLIHLLVWHSGHPLESVSSSWNCCMQWSTASEWRFWVWASIFILDTANRWPRKARTRSKRTASNFFFMLVRVNQRTKQITNKREKTNNMQYLTQLILIACQPV